MSRFLLLDVGAGTLDVLFYDDEAGQHYKAVVRSPVLCAAERAQQIAGDLLVSGVEMGGGSLLEVLSQHAGKARVIVSASAAMTLSHNPDRLRSAGLTIVDDLQAAKAAGSTGFSTLELLGFTA